MCPPGHAKSHEGSEDGGEIHDELRWGELRMVVLGSGNTRFLQIY